MPNVKSRGRKQLVKRGEEERAVKRARRGTVVEHFLLSDLTAVEQEADVLKDKYVCFLNFGPHAKADMEALVKRLGGEVRICRQLLGIACCPELNANPLGKCNEGVVSCVVLNILRIADDVECCVTASSMPSGHRASPTSSPRTAATPLRRTSSRAWTSSAWSGCWIATAPAPWCLPCRTTTFISPRRPREKSLTSAALAICELLSFVCIRVHPKGCVSFCHSPSVWAFAPVQTFTRCCLARCASLQQMVLQTRYVGCAAAHA